MMASAMMDEDFEAAVLAAPDDAEPRRRLALALRGHDDARSELIDVELAMLEWLRRDPTGSGWAALAQRAADLVRMHGTVWRRSLDGLPGRFRFMRGCIEGAMMSAREFLACAPVLMARAPIRHLELTGTSGLMAELAARPELARLRTLDLADEQLGDHGLAELVASPHLGGLGALWLGWNGITETGVRVLAAAHGALPSLRYVDLTANPAPAVMERFAADPETGHVIAYPGDLPPLGRALEAEHGELAWLHAPSRLAPFPPLHEQF